MSLSVSEGHLVLLVEGGKRKTSLRSRRKYSDNQWHTVSSLCVCLCVCVCARV